ncbi:MAG TPA: primosomal protein N' [Tepidisphaeraceae bacterium]|jgi:primosomal protein N' (replication factor Y)|nr:primosomal protein N' [Tepidisphaeraceae bacterium]
MKSLFGDIEALPQVQEKAEGPFVGVALENSLDKVLDYSVPAKMRSLIRIGQRVRVPLGRNNRPAFGYVISTSATSDYPRVKPLLNIDDERVLVTPGLMKLALWMSRYYCAALGSVIESIVPSAVKKKTGIGHINRIRLLWERDRVQALLEKTKAPKRRAILGRLLLVEPGEAVELVRLAGEAGATPATVKKLARMGIISVTSEMDWGNQALEGESSDSKGHEPDRELNEDQQKVFDELKPRLASGFSVNLLMGVTGSGKTEVYLQCMREVVNQGKQAVVLVPEIALTPQTVKRFTARFKRVAILHSGLSATERHRHWQTIASGQADVVVGARSAVFAPLPNLGMIVVDEEHESSYKQDTVPRYHARDVAIKRAQLEGVPIILGSATPSLETYQRVQPTEKSEPSAYHLLELPRRVRGLAMPHVELVDMKLQNKSRTGVHLLSERLEGLLRVTLQQGHQAILLLNRRGYSNFVYCVHCQEAVQCKYCDATMTYHRAAGTDVNSAAVAKGVHTGHLHCHYCLAVQPLPEKCPTCQKKLSLFGLGTQRVEEEIRRKFPDLRFERVDSDTMRSAKDYEQLLGRFARGEIQVMLGTQMIAKGLDYPNVTLVGVISGDTALSLPDFRAAERTFQLITQVAGRAGRGDAPGRVVLQTFMPDDPTIQAAIKQDFQGFAKRELVHRKEVGLPPFGRMVRIVLRDQDQDKLQKLSEDLAAQVIQAVNIEEAAPGESAKRAIIVRGPMPCAISRISGYFRNQIVLGSTRPERLQRVLKTLREKGDLAKTDRVAVDVDPVSLL